MSDAEMNVGTPEAASRSETLFGGEKDYAAMYNMICAHSVAQIVRCAALFSFADHLAAGPATAEAVARVEGLDVDATFRLMRACAAYGLMNYDKDRGFSATPLLATLRTDDPRSLCAMAMVQAGHGHWAPWGRLDEVIRTGRPQTEVALGSSVWAYFATPAGAREGQAFSQAMGGITGILMLEAARLIDTGSVEFAVDVGGASGALIHALMKQNAALRGAVLDLPENSAEAAKAAEVLGLQERLSIIGGDFFAKVPAADLYLLKHVLHDWKDDECVSILRNCRGAIKPSGRMVLIEIVLPDVDPPPYATQVDLTMLAVLGSRERTLEEYKILLATADFRFTSLTPTATPFSLIEAVAA
jgi:hypothetical protein